MRRKSLPPAIHVLQVRVFPAVGSVCSALFAHPVLPEMAALLLHVVPGNEVIVPAFTFPSTPNAFILHGARPVFVDIRADRLNIDEKRLEERITERTKAIFLIHYAGVGCEMETIIAVARRHGIAVVEDNAHGLYGKYRDTAECPATKAALWVC